MHTIEQNVMPLASITTVPATKAARVPVRLLAVSVDVIITNLFAPQTLIGLMASSFQLQTSSSGIIAMIPSLGYAAGLFFIVPLSDLVENRKLIVQMLICRVLAAAGVIVAPNAVSLFALLIALGASCSVMQVLIPAASQMTAPEDRGRVIGDIMSGLMVGVLLSRPIASFFAGVWRWQGFYVVSAVSLALLAITLRVCLKPTVSIGNATYGTLIGSLWRLFATEPILRNRAISAAIMMGAFNLFWTTVAYVLQSEPFSMGQLGIALFALAGAGGAIVTPVVGRLSDNGYGKQVTILAHVTLILGFMFAAFWFQSSSLSMMLKIGGLALSAVMLDIGVMGDQIVGRYLINRLNPAARGRTNGIFSGVFFIGGALGSAISGYVLSAGGWETICYGGVL